MIKDIDESIKVVFSLSRVRNLKRISFQYKDFFETPESKECKHFILTDSDVVDISRNEKRSIYEIAKDTQYKSTLEKAFDKASDSDDIDKINTFSIMLEITDEAIAYLQVLKKAHDIIDSVIEKDEKETQEK